MRDLFNSSKRSWVSSLHDGLFNDKAFEHVPEGTGDDVAPLAA